jgi:hypothetical protein
MKTWLLASVTTVLTVALVALILIGLAMLRTG